MKINKYDKKYFEPVVKASINISDVARNLGINPFCGNRNTIKKYIKLHNIDTSHFLIYCGDNGRINNFFQSRKLSDILTTNSNFNTTHLKERLYKEGLKTPICEKCGQGENWHGEHMSLILDHINGETNDLRIENLRILCPNCSATLPTHGGKNMKQIKKQKNKKSNLIISITQRKVKRPEFDLLEKEIKELGYSGTGRKYGVSDNAVRKWIKFYHKYNLKTSE
jgi:hypothetical protein